MPERLYLARGLLGRIDCVVESNPPQTVVVWSKDGRLMDLENARHIRVGRHGALLVKPVSSFDEGRYTCTPYSPLGPGDPSTAVQVFVRGTRGLRWLGLRRFDALLCPSPPSPVGVRKYCDEYVCYLFVCPLPYLRNHTAECHQIFVHVACGRG